MIDKLKLKDSFNFIGEKRLSHFIELYLQNNESFIANAERLIQKQKWEKLSDLIHKTKGSFSIFFVDDLKDSFTCFEKNINEKHLDNLQEDWKKLISNYNSFIVELLEILKGCNSE